MKVTPIRSSPTGRSVTVQSSSLSSSVSSASRFAASPWRNSSGQELRRGLSHSLQSLHRHLDQSQSQSQSQSQPLRRRLRGGSSTNHISPLFAAPIATTSMPAIANTEESGYSLGIHGCPTYISSKQRGIIRTSLVAHTSSALGDVFQLFQSPHQSSSISPWTYASALAIAPSPAAVATTAASEISFFKLLLVFTAGGLFFSTAIAAVTACYAMGMDNVRRVWDLVRIILTTIWKTFVYGLQTTKRALLEDFEDEGEDEGEGDNDGVESLEEATALSDVTGNATSNDIVAAAAAAAGDRKTKKKQSWKWRSAWAVLKEQLGETRRQAAEGVQALRQEANLYTAAVGPPGLIPLQYVVDRLMPLSFATLMEQNIRKALSDFPRQRTIKKMTLSSFQAGSKAPVLEAARVYDVDDTIAFDYAVRWESELEATVQVYSVGGLARFPVSLKHLNFQGTVRVILTPLTATAPGFGAILISLPQPPRIQLDVRVLGGEVTKLPFLRYEITNALQKAISDNMLWPRRVVIPTVTEGMPKRNLLTAKELKALETSDPLLQAEQALAAQPLLKSMHDPMAAEDDEAVQKQRKNMFRLALDKNGGGNTNNATSDDDMDAYEETADYLLDEAIDKQFSSSFQFQQPYEKGIVMERLQQLFSPSSVAHDDKSDRS